MYLDLSVCLCVHQFINAVRCVLYDSVFCQSSADYVLGSVCLSVCSQYINAVRCVLYDSVCCQSSADYVLGSVCLSVCGVNLLMLLRVYCMTVCVVSCKLIMYSDLSVCLCVQSIY